MNFTNLFIFLTILSQFTYGTIKNKRKIKTNLGLAIISPIIQSTKKTTTTNLRIEQKNILETKQVENILAPFLKKNLTPHHKKVSFTSREQTSEDHTNSTITLYGKKIFFWNHHIKTNIKLRARVYLSKKNDDRDFKRIPLLKNNFFLELKIKNARPCEFNVSRKYRLLISNDDLKFLYQINSRDLSFASQLRQLKNHIESANPEKSKEEINTFFSVLEQLARIDQDFIRPIFAVQYTRQAYKFVDSFYYKRKFFMKKWPKDKIEYQVTLDQNIKVYKINAKKLHQQSFDAYLTENLKDNLIYEYPKDLYFVEFKAPLVTLNRHYQKHSFSFKTVKKNLLIPLFEILKSHGKYKKNKGKLASIALVSKSE